MYTWVEQNPGLAALWLILIVFGGCLLIFILLCASLKSATKSRGR